MQKHKNTSYEANNIYHHQHHCNVTRQIHVGLDLQTHKCVQVKDGEKVSSLELIQNAKI